jgi:hypothetical protein
MTPLSLLDHQQLANMGQATAFGQLGTPLSVLAIVWRRIPVLGLRLFGARATSVQEQTPRAADERTGTARNVD